MIRSHLSAHAPSSRGSAPFSKATRRKISTAVAATITLVLLLLVSQPAAAEDSSPFIYYAPRPDAQLVSARTTLGLRQGEEIDVASLSSDLFEVTGSTSGSVDGRVILALDQRTVIFEPEQPFAPGEQISVTVSSGLSTVDGTTIGGTSYAFSISPIALTPPLSAATAGSFTVEDSADIVQVSTAQDGASLDRLFMTVPADYPPVSVTVSSGDLGEGFIFLADVRFTGMGLGANTPYLQILDNNGEPVYYQRMRAGVPVFDFRRLPDGRLIYGDPATDAYYAMDDTYTVVDSYRAGHGYTIDLHDLVVLPNGNSLYMIYDPQPVDMSEIVAGGVPTATVVGTIVQEMDTGGNIVFEWRSWDDIAYTDSVVSPQAPYIDLVHGNAVTVDSDDNILLSSRNLNEVTKLDRETGRIIWRLGGVQNEFALADGTELFMLQHDIQRLSNGNITVFDNGTGSRGYSRAVEYILDEENKTVTQVWQYRSTPDTMSIAMGSAQRLSNGNTVIGWGTASTTVTEVNGDGDLLLSMSLVTSPGDSDTAVSYRALRYPWKGRPGWPPTLVQKSSGENTTLYYSWNGATDVASYRVLGGNSLATMSEIATQVKSGFETKTVISDTDDPYCLFQVVPIDNEEREGIPSNIVISDKCSDNNLYLPILSAQS